MKDQLDVASKLIFQTSDPNYVNQNALASIEQGDILTHAVNQPLTQLNNGSHDITTQQSFGQMWKSLSNEIVGISESMLGQNAPSGTPWRATDALLQENHSLFELMTENKGLHIEDMFRTYVIPHLKKKLNTSKEIASVLAEHDITSVDGKYIKANVDKIVSRELVKKVLADEEPTPEEQAALTQGAEQGIKGSLSELGNTRFFKPSELDNKTWKMVLDGIEWELEVDVTGEGSNAKDDMTTLTTVFQTIANPATAGVLQTPAGKLLFNRILQKAGSVSPLELSVMPPAQPQMQPQDTQAMPQPTG